MDFSVGIAVLVLVTVLVVAVIGYGIYLNRRHDHWEHVAGQTASDGQSSGLGAVRPHTVGDPLVKHEKSSSTRRPRTHAGGEKGRSTDSRIRSPIVAGSPWNTTKPADTDACGLPYMGVDDVYRGGIDTAGGKIDKRERRPRGSSNDVFGSEERKSLPVRPKVDVPQAATSSDAPEGAAAEGEIKEGIIGEVRTKPRDKTSLDKLNERIGAKQNNVHVPVASTQTATRTKADTEPRDRNPNPRTESERIVPIGITKGERGDRSRVHPDNGRLDDYVLLRVMGAHPNAFPLRELSRFMVNRKLTFDEIGLFSMRDEASKDLMFRVANVNLPGPFNRNEMETFATEGLSFIMYLPPLANPQQSFELMLSVATECARCFDAVVQDELNNKLSNQTITHYRHRVAEFRRKQMSM